MSLRGDAGQPTTDNDSDDNGNYDANEDVVASAIIGRRVVGRLIHMLVSYSES